MKEIGGYFGLETFHGKEYHDKLIALNSGRNALAYLLRQRRISKLYIPYFLCDSVSNVCEREQCPVEYYKISADFRPIFDKQLQEDEWIYVVNFYGQIQEEEVAEMKKCWHNMIFDNVHAFFQKPVPGVDTIYSCRKFFGVPDGAYLSTDAVSQRELPIDVSKERMKHILGRFEGVASDYYGDFKANDHSFVELDVREMSALTRNLLCAVDYDAVRQKRNENFHFLHEKLGQSNKLKLIAPEGPYCYPFYCSNGMQVKQALAQKQIYVATLWPNVLGMDETLEKDYAQNILPLPCDQRYDKAEMERMVEVLLSNTIDERCVYEKGI